MPFLLAAPIPPKYPNGILITKAHGHGQDQTTMDGATPGTNQKQRLLAKRIEQHPDL